MKKNYFLLFAVIVFLGACSSAVKDKTKSSVPEGYELVFEDDFSGESLDLTKWAYRADNKHRSVQLKENVEIKDGNLVLNLHVYKDSVEGKLASGAGIVSRKRFRYGYYEVRSKLGDGVDDDKDGKVDEGWHHSFWAMAAVVEGDAVSTTYPGIRRTEIDCYENSSEHRWDKKENGLHRFTQHIIVWDENGKEAGRLPKPPADKVHPENFNPHEWNTYAFLWTEKEVKFYVNGKLSHIADYPVDQYTHDEINIWLTAISANWNKKGQEESLAVYDYFRFYKKK